MVPLDRSRKISRNVSYLRNYSAIFSRGVPIISSLPWSGGKIASNDSWWAEEYLSDEKISQLSRLKEWLFPSSRNGKAWKVIQQCSTLRSGGQLLWNYILGLKSQPHHRLRRRRLSRRRQWVTPISWIERLGPTEHWLKWHPSTCIYRATTQTRLITNVDLVRYVEI